MTEPEAPRSNRPYQHVLDSYLALLILITITFFLLAVVDFNELGSVWEEAAMIAVSAVTALMLLLALAASGARRRTIQIAVIISLITITSSVGATLTDAVFHPGLLWLGLVVAAPVIVMRRIATHELVTTETVLGAVCAYLLIALAFSYAFLALDGPGNPFFGTVEPTTAFPYFSLVTITTLGYGDLNPVTELGRILSGSEAVIGSIFLVVVVARLVSLWSRRPDPSSPRFLKRRPDDPTKE
jgi:hypothetical protein